MGRKISTVRGVVERVIGPKETKTGSWFVQLIVKGQTYGFFGEEAEAEVIARDAPAGREITIGWYPNGNYRNIDHVEARYDRTTA